MHNTLYILLFLYFLQGLPYGFQARYLPIELHQRGMSLGTIGLFKLLLFPWFCKFLWAPYVDRYLKLVTWIRVTTFMLAISYLIFSICDFSNIYFFAISLFLINFFTATQDIAVDGLAIQILPTYLLTSGNSIQVVGYKLGAVAGASLLTFINETNNESINSLYSMLGLLFLLSTLVTIYALPSGKKLGVLNKSSSEKVLDHFNLLDLICIPGTLKMIAFTLMYKLGEVGLIGYTPLMLLDGGVPVADVKFWSAVVAQALSLFASILMGYLKVETFTMLSCCMALRLIPHVLVFLQYNVFIYGSMLLINFVGGLISPLMFTLMMSLSQVVPRHMQASHYSVLATSEVLGKLIFSACSGYLVDIVGFKFFTSILLLCNLPALYMLKYIQFE